MEFYSYNYWKIKGISKFTARMTSVVMGKNDNDNEKNPIHTSFLSQLMVRPHCLN